MGQAAADYEPAEGLSQRFSLGKRRSDRTVESGVAGVGLLEVDHLRKIRCDLEIINKVIFNHLGREELLESLRISLAATIKQAMSFEFTPKSLLRSEVYFPSQ